MPELFPHQRLAREFLKENPRAILADEPGAGKTAPVIRAADVLGIPPQRIVVICPAVARTMWCREFAKWWPQAEGKVIVLSYQQYALSAKLRKLVEEENPALLILDEVHYLSNPESKRTLLLLGPQGLARKVPRVWALSGTVMQRNPAQLYPILRGLFPDVVKCGYGRWKDMFCETEMRKIPGKRKLAEVIVGGKNLVKLRALLLSDKSPVRLLRRTLDEVGMTLPPLLWETAYHDNGEPFFWDEVSELDVEELKENGFYKAAGMKKALPAAELIYDGMEAGDYCRPLVFAYHLDVIARMAEFLRLRDAALPVYTITGATTPKVRDAIIKEFQTTEGRAVLICQITTMETAVTLTNADRVELVESTWNSSKDEQAVKRAHRIGQKKPLLVRVHLAVNTADEAIQVKQLRQKDERSVIGV